MSRCLLFLSALLLFYSCNLKKNKIVEVSFADSLITHNIPSKLEKTNQGDLLFWQQRMDSFPENYVNGPKLSSALITRFHLTGNINDLLEADSLLQKANIAYQRKEDGIYLKLASLSILRHRFHDAQIYLDSAIKLSGSTYATLMTRFDVLFETGAYQNAENILKQVQPNNTYAYYFRQSKLQHYTGTLDSAIAYMLKAVDKSDNNTSLKQVALSNAGDLYLHNGNLERSYDCYKKSIRIDASDLHSLMGIGWIALVHDKNDSLAEKIFQFVHAKNFLPDAILKLEQVAEQKGDLVAQKKWANEFVTTAKQPVYGNMYNKYLIQLYTEVLENPEKAVILAKQEIQNRTTPQVFAWYAWALLKNHQPDEALKIYQEHVSGQPLEGLELYYMGKLMQQEGKGYNAREFFKAANKNRYDLSPLQQKALQESLE